MRERPGEEAQRRELGRKLGQRIRARRRGQRLVRELEAEPTPVVALPVEDPRGGAAALAS
jgi:hypothetical protein